jgi:hypothetical protein
MDKNLTYEARTYDLGEWLAGPWVQELIESEDGDHYQVTHKESGQVLATLPAWAGSIALWMCVARDAVPALLADNAELSSQLASQRADNFREAARILRENPLSAYDRLLGEVNLARRAVVAGEGR